MDCMSGSVALEIVMCTQPKGSRHSSKVASLPSIRRELYREHCQGEDSKRYTVIVYRPFADLNVTRYEPQDGTPARFNDACLFEIKTNARTLPRCL